VSHKSPIAFPTFISPLRIILQMKPETAAKIVALRPALEALIVKATSDPECVVEPEPLDAELMTVVRALSKPNAARHGIKEEERPQR
jgi:ATP-dependent RNA helicase A